MGRRHWPRTGRRVAVLRRLRLRLRFLCPVGARLWLGERLQLSVLWRLRLLLITNYLTLFEGPPKVAPLASNSSRFQKLPSKTRVAAAAFGFLVLSHAFDGPDLYGASSFFETMPSRPSLQTAYALASLTVRFIVEVAPLCPSTTMRWLLSKICKRCGGRSELALTLSDASYDCLSMCRLQIRRLDCTRDTGAKRQLRGARPSNVIIERLGLARKIAAPSSLRPKALAVLFDDRLTLAW